MIGSCLFEVMLGATGLIGICLKFITPLSIAPTITLICLSLFETATRYASAHWWIAIL